MAEFDPIEKHFLDRAFQSNFALWSALLTINGIILSAFGLLRVITPGISPLLVSLLVGSCAVSILLLVINFLVAKQHYLERKCHAVTHNRLPVSFLLTNVELQLGSPAHVKGVVGVDGPLCQ